MKDRLPKPVALAVPPLVAVDRSGELPLSFAQQRLWLLNQLDPDTPVYNMAHAIRLTGALNISAVNRSLTQIQSRHEVLRTVFPSASGRPRQRIASPAPVMVPVIDISIGGERLARQLAEAEAMRPFDLALGPLWRRALLRLSPDDHVLLLTMHHIVSDGWSIAVFTRELTHLYSSIAAGRRREMKPLAIQYADYAVWQRQWLSGDTLRSSVQTWKERLAGAAPVELPTDFVRPPVARHRGATYSVSIDADATARLNDRSRREGVTPFMTLLAALYVLIARWAGQHDVTIGTPIANRREIEVEDLIGFFVNVLALRARIDTRQRVLDLLQVVRDVSLDAYERQNVPFEHIVEELAPERSPSRSLHAPLFDVLFVFQRTPSLDGTQLLRAEPWQTPTRLAPFDLTLEIRVNDGTLAASFNYATELFERGTIEHLAKGYRAVLRAIVADPLQPVWALELLEPAERVQVLTTWQGPRETYAAEETLADLFAHQVARTPDAVAVVCEGRQVSYAALARRAAGVAAQLQARGVGAEQCVGLCAERSIELVVGLLGIVQAGAAYVPLDPRYPAARRAQMAADAQLTVIVQTRTMPEAPAGTAVVWVEEASVAPASAVLPRVVGRPDHLAYVIYTSGSSGRPKGVMVTHRQVARLLAASTHVYAFTSADVWTLFHSYAFDFSVWEVWGALAWGGRLVVVPYVVSRAPELFGTLVRREAVTVLNQTPSAFQSVQAHLAEGHALRYVIFGGEALEPATVMPWAARQGARAPALVNMYGITETTVHVTARVLSVTTPWRGVGSPIGPPLSDLTVWVRDWRGGLAPVGAEGELYVGGAGVTRGYLGAAGATAARFVPDGLSGTPGARLYRTGDRARWRGDGELEYRGRVDAQIKLRGHRIEPGEIEAALRQHPRVRDAVVVLQDGAAEARRLIAYVTAVPDAGEQEAARRSRVARWQQVYDTLYRTEAGAHAPDFNLAGWTSSYTGEAIPSTEMQQWVDATVAQVLAVRPRQAVEIGCGTGLLLTRVAPACAQYLGVDVSADVVQQLRTLVQARPALQHVEVRQGLADDLADVPDASVDLVLLNSVVQYFPDQAYLRRVLDEALRITAPGGHLFVGDVRDLRLLEAYHTSVQVQQARGTLSVRALRQRIREAQQQEEELAVAPAFFEAWARQAPALGRVEVRLKAGAYDNELSRFRYDVLLRVGAKEVMAPPERWIAWQPGGAWPHEIRAALAETPDRAVGLRGLRDRRVAGALAAVDWLHAGPRTVDEITEAAVPDGEDPDAVWQLAHALGVSVWWTRFDTPGMVDVIFNGRWIPAPTGPASPRLDDEAYTNVPSRGDLAPGLSAELQRWVGRTVPDYMVPSAVVVVPALPLTANGKLDRAALPVPEDESGPTWVADEVPRTAVEEIVAGVWAAVLKRGTVGRTANFFEIGGHSLLATQVMARVNEVLGVAVPLRMLFEAPTVAGLAAAVEAARQAGGPDPLPALGPVARDDRLPLSFAQQRLWFLDQLEPETALYNMPQAIRLQGAVAIAGVQWALGALATRHEALRTRFPATQGTPWQEIAPPKPVALPVIDVSAGGERLARHLAAAEAARPFDLAQGPVWRALLLQLGRNDHVLLLTLHHIVSDGWSLGVLVGEFTELYAAWRERRPPRLTPLPVQYADYAVWQRGWLTGPVLDAQLAYWRTQLADLPVLDLPTDRPRPVVASHQGASRNVPLDAETTARLAVVGRHEGVTLFMALFAAWALLLARYTGQWDIAVGSPIANRRRHDIEPLIGFFVNQLTLRIRMQPVQSFRALLAAVRTVALEAYEHQDVPFEKLVEELAPDRDSSRSPHSPLFQVALALDNVSRSEAHLDGISVQGWRTDGRVARFDLALSLAERRGELFASLEYAIDLFDAAMIDRIGRHYCQLLSAALDDLNTRLCEIDILTKAERRQLLDDCGGATRSPAHDACVHELFAQHAGRTPDRCALSHGREHMTYAALNLRANSLARYLASKGMRPEDCVAVCLTPSTEMVVALLGVLKAGACYVPLDPDLPLERIAFMMDDLRMTVVVTVRRLEGVLSGSPAAVLVSLDRDSAAISRCSAAPLAFVRRDYLAYVMYTSGSTGAPKGVGVEHHSITALVRHQEYAPLTSDDRVAQVAPYAFDASTFEVWGPLLNGGTVVLIPHDVLLDPDRFLERLRSEQVTALFLTTALFNEVARRSRRHGGFVGVRHLLFGGETVDPIRVRDVVDMRLPLRLLHVYGPTETTTFATWQLVDRSAPTGMTVPIGRSIDQTQLLVLDPSRNLVPRSVPGELYIGGAGIARGYMNRPSLTAERFVPRPFGPNGARLYRTGDRVRWRPDGTLEYLSRTDHQIKLRGHRIEPGEIEATLRQQVGVVAAAVILREDEPGDRRLVAYVVKNGDVPSAEHIEASLAARLPAYMVPAALVFLDELPLTRNGKLDRAALPRPDTVCSGESYIEPRTPLEALLVEIWCDVLKVQRIGIEDNFFDLGGHSLLATQLTSRIRDTLAVDFTVKDLFEAQTVAGLAERLEAGHKRVEGLDADLNGIPLDHA